MIVMMQTQMNSDNKMMIQIMMIAMQVQMSTMMRVSMTTMQMTMVIIVMMMAMVLGERGRCGLPVMIVTMPMTT